MTGIIDAVDPDPVALATTWARSIAGNAPLAIAGVRDALAALERDPGLGDAATRQRLDTQRRAAFGSADLSRGLEAARQRRPPHFEGD